MTIAELITELSKLDPTLLVIQHGGECGGYDHIDTLIQFPIQPAKRLHSTGEFDSVKSEDFDPATCYRAVLLT